MRRVMLSALAVALLGFGAPVLGEEPKGGPLFNGKNLDGFEGLIDKYWSVKDGAIVGKAEVDPKFNTFLCSKKKYKNFEMKFEVRLTDAKGNSGVQIRSRVADPEKFAVAGPQCDVGGGFWGSLYGERFGGMMKAAPPNIVKEKVKASEFNDYYIKCVDRHVTIKVNGETTVDGDFEKMPEDGIIAFQLHAGGPMEVTFRNISFKELP